MKVIFWGLFDGIPRGFSAHSAGRQVPKRGGGWCREVQKMAVSGSAETESRATKVCRTTRKIGRNCGFGQIPSRLAVKLDLWALKVAKATPIGAAPSGNRPEICVGWLSKHAESKAFTAQLQLYPRSHILVPFDANGEEFRPIFRVNLPPSHGVLAPPGPERCLSP